MKRYVRTWLYVSASRPEQLPKAMDSDADAIVIDLEDTVDASAKDKARLEVRDFLSTNGSERVAVRINPPGTSAGQADLESLAERAVGAIRIPKASTEQDISAVFSRHLQGGPELQPIVESAKGFAGLEEMALSQGVKRICLGEGDLSEDLRITDRRWLDYLRLQVVVTSRVAEIWPPIQGVFPQLDDDSGLRRSTAEGLSCGFFGRSVLHPRQVPIVNEVLTPSDRDVLEARELLDALEVASDGGSTALRLASGRFVDASAKRGARRVLGIAEDLGL